MAGFFSLGGGGRGGSGRSGAAQNDNPRSSAEDHRRQPPSLHEIPPEALYWYRHGVHPNQNHQGFELWQHQQQQDLYALGVGVGGPSRAVSDEGGGSGGSGRGASASAVRAGGISCQDCGNQSKKDCPHLRCRTCCHSRGLECQTHVKSTWVSAAKRRERQQQIGALKHQHHLQFRSSSGSEASKRPRDTGTANPESPMDCTNNNTTGLELGAFPAEVNSTALFRCVRVSSSDDNDDQYAYQTAVTIGGHVFRGILYDRGPEAPNYAAASSSGGGIPQALPLNLITAVAAAGENSSGVPTALLYDSASALYTAAPPISTYNMAPGTQIIFPHQRP